MIKCNSPVDCCSRRLDGAKPLFSATQKMQTSPCAPAKIGNSQRNALNSLFLFAFYRKVCGCKWNATPNSIQQNTGCPQCTRRRINLAHTKTHEQFVVDLAKENSTVEIVGQYINSKTKIACRCCICGNEWEMCPNALLRGQGCAICAKEKRKSTK